MILTCPQCDTKYVVKDGAIPTGGRQVRCASCKHSWHQDPESGAASHADSGEDSAAQAAAAEPSAPVAAEMGGPPQPDMSRADRASLGDAPAVGEGVGADDRSVVAPDLPGASGDNDPQFGEAASFAGNYGLTAPSVDAPIAGRPAPSDQPAYDDDPPLSETMIDDEMVAEEEDFSIRGFDEDEGARSGRLFKAVLMVVVLVALAVAAFWYFAPGDLQARLGLTRADSSPLKIMLDSRDRQPLQSGNELLAISGRVINPTDEEQPVPAIRAELRNRQSQKLIYSWTIRPQSRVLPPNGMTRFNSAEVDVPQGGDDISLSLGGE